jgi:hypothetical protein
MPTPAQPATQDTQRKPKPRLGNLAALFLLGAGFTLVHILVSRRYGFHRDELDKPYGITNDTIGRYDGVYVCGPPLKEWPEFWKDFQVYG